MKLADIKVGDVLAYWHDTGAFGARLCYARVVKVAKVKVRVSAEDTHFESWAYPAYFAHKVDAKTLAELVGEGVNV